MTKNKHKNLWKVKARVNNAPSNNSMDVRAKQRLCYRVVFLTLTGLVAVSPHVISAVRCFLVNSMMSWIKYIFILSGLIISASIVAYPKCANIRNVDFRNRVYPLNEFGFTEGTKRLRVSKGRYEDHSEPTSLSFLYFEVTDVVFGNLTGDGKDEAAVVAIYGNNSGSFFLTDTYVFGCVGGKVKLINILKQSRIEKESEMLVHESIKKPVKIRNGILSVAYGTEGARPSPEFTTIFRYKVSRGNFVAYKRPIRRKNL